MKLRIGTRKSHLARTQTELVVQAIKAANPGIEVETILITASGDWKPSDGEKPLSEKEGGKGQFVKDIEEAILDNRIDIGVHSLKDVPTLLPHGLCVEHFMPRGDARDAFISHTSRSIDSLKEGSIVGTTSPRRKAVILNRRPDLKVVPLRGNIDTRLEKLKNGQVDAIILAVAGLERIDKEDVISSIIEPEAMLPAVGQGTLAMEIREHDHSTREILDKINHEQTALVSYAERSILAALGGSCHTPIGSYGIYTPEGKMRLRGMMGDPDGSQIIALEETCEVLTREDAQALGLRIGMGIKRKLPAQLLKTVEG